MPRKNNSHNENEFEDREQDLNDDNSENSQDFDQEHTNQFDVSENNSGDLLIGNNNVLLNTDNEANENIIANDDISDNEVSANKEESANLNQENPDEVNEIEDANKRIDETVKLTMFMDKLNTFNSMFKTDINANKFVDAVTTAWQLLQDEDRNVRLEGWGTLGDIFRDVLKEAFTAERDLSYKEHRLPDYAEIIRSSNYLMRVAMFNFTDLYSNKKKSYMFKSTAFGGLNAKDMAKLTSSGKSQWRMDQKSDKAWNIQSADARNIAKVWQKDADPYERLISEMKALAESGNGRIADADHRDIYNKLAAAEWMLINNEEMLIESSEKPGEKIPNWGNKYWKALLETREALGIPKHISIRELIQGDYAESSKAVNDINFNERQFEDHLLNAEVRGMFDSMEAQESEFKIQREEIKLNRTISDNHEVDIDSDAVRYPHPVHEENEFIKQRHSEKENNFIVDTSNHKDIDLNIV